MGISRVCHPRPLPLPLPPPHPPVCPPTPVHFHSLRGVASAERTKADADLVHPPPVGDLHRGGKKRKLLNPSFGKNLKKKTKKKTKKLLTFSAARSFARPANRRRLSGNPEPRHPIGARVADDVTLKKSRRNTFRKNPLPEDFSSLLTTKRNTEARKARGGG